MQLNTTFLLHIFEKSLLFKPERPCILWWFFTFFSIPCKSTFWLQINKKTQLFKTLHPKFFWCFWKIRIISEWFIAASIKNEQARERNFWRQNRFRYPTDSKARGITRARKKKTKNVGSFFFLLSKIEHLIIFCSTNKKIHCKKTP